MVNWGNWEHSGGNGMRVGLEAHSEPVSHSEGACTITVEYWTENEHTYSDPQSLNLGGAIGGSIGYTNNQGSAATKRGERTYTYNYGPNEYGANTISRTFSATVTGTYNGVTPTKSITVSIPDRPIGAPASPTQCSVSRVSDGANKVSWNNRDTAGEPYRNLVIERTVDGGPWNRVASPDGGQSYTDSGVNPNHQYRYRVRAVNGAGDSTWDESGFIWTSPDAPTSCVRTPTGADQVISWVNRAGYNEYETQIWHRLNGVWDTAELATRGNGVTSYTHVAPSAADKHLYRVRHRTTSGQTLYSDYSNVTTETGGTFLTPNPSTSLVPSSSLQMDPTKAITLTWKHNSTDGTPQSAYQVQYREVGAGIWTTLTQTTSGTSSHVLAANTFTYAKNIEWQVMTWGSAPTGSAWSASATFVTQDAILKKYPLYLDISSGRMEARSQLPAHAHAHKAAGSHTFNDSVFEILSFDTLVSQSGSVTVNTQATISPGSTFTIGETGIYHCAAACAVESNPNGRRVLRMRVGAVSVIQQETAPYTITGGSGQAGPMISATVKLNAGDLVVFEFYNNKGGVLYATVRADLYWGRISKIG